MDEYNARNALHKQSKSMAKQTNNEIVLWSENQNTAATDEEATRASFIDSTERVYYSPFLHIFGFSHSKHQLFGSVFSSLPSHMPYPMQTKDIKDKTKDLTSSVDFNAQTAPDEW